MISDIKLVIFSDSDIRDGKIIYWNFFSYAEFYCNTENQKKNKKRCINFMTKYQNKFSAYARVRSFW